MKRMDRYKDTDIKLQKRTSKNQELYQNVSSNVIYTNITDVTNTNAFEITPSKMADSNRTTRESYQRMQKYQHVEPTPRLKKELDDFNYLYQRRENKVYDINSVLEEARKSRNVQDDKEAKRKLKNKAYNILTDINKGELEKYREEKRKKMLTPEEDEIRELIDTIASKTLAGEIDKATSVNLLSDLMATNVLDQVSGIKEIKEETKEEVIVPEQVSEKEQTTDTEEPTKDPILKDKDPEFYTRSMDLSDKDFNLSNDFVEKKMPLILKLFIFIIIIGIIGLTVFYIYQKVK